MSITRISTHGLLSVCVPTYNRASYLEQCLAALVPQALDLGVPIYVSDNGSTDNTQNVIAKYEGVAGELIKCVRQDENLGYDINHKTVIGLVETEYSWLLGDDDVVLDGALKRVIDALISEPECELMLLNAMLTDNALQPRDVQFNIESNVVLKKCNDLLKYHSDKLTFGMMVINARIFNDTQADRFIGTAHFYAGVVYEYLAISYLRNGHNYICIRREPFVKLRQGERAWSQVIGDIAVRQIPEFYFRMHSCYEGNAMAAMKRAVGSYRMLLPLVRLRAERWLDRERAKELQKYFIGNYRYRLFLISNMPVVAAKLLGFIGVLMARAMKALKRTYFTNKITIT
jgi:glycosyltransferase involved in cell wall biosynthesis